MLIYILYCQILKGIVPRDEYFWQVLKSLLVFSKRLLIVFNFFCCFLGEKVDKVSASFLNTGNLLIQKIFDAPYIMLPMCHKIVEKAACYSENSSENRL
jgi:hypothetical protein